MNNSIPHTFHYTLEQEFHITHIYTKNNFILAILEGTVEKTNQKIISLGFSAAAPVDISTW